jgi:hypothetical protein
VGGVTSCSSREPGAQAFEPRLTRRGGEAFREPTVRAP